MVVMVEVAVNQQSRSRRKQPARPLGRVELLAQDVEHVFVTLGVPVWAHIRLANRSPELVGLHGLQLYLMKRRRAVRNANLDAWRGARGAVESWVPPVRGQMRPIFMRLFGCMC